MDQQAFTLLTTSLKELKNEIHQLRIEMNDYQKHNNKTVVNLKVNVARLMVATGIVGFASGGLGHAFSDKVMPIIKQEKTEVQKNHNNKGDK